MTSTADPNRRRKPRLWDTDWLMLRGLSRELERMLTVAVEMGTSVLDYGCGTMPYRSMVEGRGARYFGADFERGAGVVLAPDGRLPLPASSVDAVLSVQVLEHVRDLDLYLLEAARVLKDEGVLILSTHGTWLYHPHPEDHRRWTRTGLIHDIEARGFCVDRIEAVVGPLATTTMVRLTGYAFFLRRLPIVGSALVRALALVMNCRGWLEDKLTPAGIRDENGCIYLAHCVKPST